MPKEPSKATIYEWVRDYTDKALKQMGGHKAKTGGHWVADEMQVDVGGQKMWLWNVMDSETRYTLASHLTPRRYANAARVVLRKAALAADKPPETITSDKLRSYIQPVKDVLPLCRIWSCGKDRLLMMIASQSWYNSAHQSKEARPWPV